MTTVAYKDGKMASDSAWTMGNKFIKSATKLLRLKSGAIIGGAGDNDHRDILPLLQTVRKFDDFPRRADLINMRIDLEIIIALPNGEVYVLTTREKEDDYDTEVGVVEIPSKVISVGSGWELALAYMDAGHSAYNAVSYAIRRDPNSRFPIHQLELKRKPNVDRTNKRRKLT